MPRDYFPAVVDLTQCTGPDCFQIIGPFSDGHMISFDLTPSTNLTGYPNILLGENGASLPSRPGAGAATIVTLDPDFGQTGSVQLANITTTCNATNFYGPVADQTFGWATKWLDLNGNGKKEVAISGLNANYGSPGSVFLLWDETWQGSDIVDILTQVDRMTRFEALSYPGSFGFDVSVTDYDCNGIDDLVISGGDSSNIGVIYVFLGEVGGWWPAVFNADSPPAGYTVYKFNGFSNSGCGWSVLGDINYNGDLCKRDLAFTCPFASLSNKPNIGVILAIPAQAVSVTPQLINVNLQTIFEQTISNPNTGNLIVASPLAGSLTGLGRARLSNVGDFDGNGFDELGIEADMNQGSGFVTYMPRTGFLDLSNYNASDALQITGYPGDQLGRMASMGLFNGDNRTDIAACAYYSNVNGVIAAGYCIILFGDPILKTQATFNATDINGINGIKFIFLSENLYLGFTVQGGVDIDLDGRSEAFFGGYGYNSLPGDSARGSTLVVRGDSSAYFVNNGWSYTYNVPYQLGLSDLNAISVNRGPKSILVKVLDVTQAYYGKFTCANSTAVSNFTVQQVNDGEIFWCPFGNQTATSVLGLYTPGLAYQPNNSTSTVLINEPAILGTSHLQLQQDSTQLVPVGTQQFNGSDPNIFGDPLQQRFNITPPFHWQLLTNASGQLVTTLSVTKSELISGVIFAQHDGTPNFPSASITTYTSRGIQNIDGWQPIQFLFGYSPIFLNNGWSYTDGVPLTLGLANLNANVTNLGPDSIYVRVLLVTQAYYGRFNCSLPATISTFSISQVSNGEILWCPLGNQFPATSLLGLTTSNYNKPIISNSTLNFIRVNRPAILGNRQLHLQQDSTALVPVGPQQFYGSDPNIIDDPLQQRFNITSPFHWQLLTNASGQLVPTVSVTKSEIDSGVLFARHDGTFNFPSANITTYTDHGVQNVDGWQPIQFTFDYAPKMQNFQAYTFIFKPGQSITLTPTMLASFSRNPSSNLVYISTVLNGNFKVGNSVFPEGASFSPQNITNGVVSVVDGSTTNINPAVQFWILLKDLLTGLTDGPYAANITYHNYPEVVQNFWNFVQYQTGTRVFPQNLTVTSNFINPRDITIFFTNLNHIQFYFNNSYVISNCTFGLINDRLITYNLDGTASQPSGSLHLNDGTLTTSTVPLGVQSFKIINFAASIINAQIPVTQGQRVILGPNNYSGTDPNNASADPSTLIWTVKDNTVLYGRYELSTTPGTAIYTWTQKQINLGAIAFQPDGTNNTPVSTVVLTNLAGQPTQQATSYSFTEVNTTPVLTVNQVTIPESQTSIILSSSNLLVTDRNSLPSELIYSVTNLVNCKFTFVATNTDTTTFTQADINSSRVMITQITRNSAISFTSFVNNNQYTSQPQVTTVSYTTIPQNPVVSSCQLSITGNQKAIITQGTIVANNPDDITLNPNLLLSVIGLDPTLGCISVISQNCPEPSFASFTYLRSQGSELQIQSLNPNTPFAFNVTASNGVLTSLPKPCAILFNTATPVQLIDSSSGGTSLFAGLGYGATGVTGGFFLFRLGAFAWVEYKIKNAAKDHSKLANVVIEQLKNSITKRSLVSEGKLNKYYGAVAVIIDKLKSFVPTTNDTTDENDRINLGTKIVEHARTIIGKPKCCGTRSCCCGFCGKISNWVTGTRAISVEALQKNADAIVDAVVKELRKEKSNLLYENRKANSASDGAVAVLHIDTKTANESGGVEMSKIVATVSTDKPAQPSVTITLTEEELNKRIREAVFAALEAPQKPQTATIVELSPTAGNGAPPPPPILTAYTASQARGASSPGADFKIELPDSSSSPTSLSPAANANFG